jgi:site-specific recombinase
MHVRGNGKETYQMLMRTMMKIVHMYLIYLCIKFKIYFMIAMKSIIYIGDNITMSY